MAGTMLATSRGQEVLADSGTATVYNQAADPRRRSTYDDFQRAQNPEFHR